MLSRLPWTPKPEIAKATAKPRRLNRDRRKHLVETVAAAMRRGRDADQVPTLLNFEAPARYSLRSRLCLEGWPWQAADEAAADIVATALRIVGAVRPSWAEGQADWAQIGSGAHIARTLCVRCGTRLPEGHHKFCSELCRGAHHMAIARLDDPDRVYGVWKAWQARWMEKQPKRICAGCGRSYQPRRPKQAYCRPECVYIRCEEVRDARAKAQA